MPKGLKKKLPETQQSSGSDDGFAVAMAKQVQSSWEKKKKENEMKFLATAKTELDAAGRGNAEIYAKVLDEMEVITERFVSDYAAIEDRIRTLWQQLLIAQASSLESGRKIHASVAEMDKTREKGQVRGMAISKKAVEDCNRLVSSLTDAE